MMKSMTKKVIMVLIFAGVFGFGTYAFAGWGMGDGHHGRYHHGSDWEHHGPEWHHRGWNGSDYDRQTGGLNDEHLNELERERESFFKATEDLRQDIYTKEAELRSELAKENPDPKKAAKLQSKISDLEAKIDQERLNHIIRMRKINPDVERMPMDRNGAGNGRFRGDYCWR